MFKDKKIHTNFPRLKFIKERYETTFKYNEKQEKIKKEIFSKEIKSKYLNE